MYQILVVEDQTEQREALKCLLERYPENFAVSVCGDLAGARTLIRESRFNLFLLDLRLVEEDAANADGLLLAREIRQIAAYQYVPIIFLTAVPEKIQEALNEAGCFRYILKPYEPEDVEACLDHLLHSPLMPPPVVSFHNFWGGTLRIPEAEVRYCCPGAGRRVQIHTGDGFYETADYTLDALERRLHHNFIRCHRRFLVNREHIADYDRSNHTLTVGGKTLPVGRRHRAGVDEFWRIAHDGIVS